MTPRLSDSRLANVGAKTIRTAYVTFHEQFRAITGRAGIRFDTQDWPGLQADTAERLGLYRRIVDLVEAAIRELELDNDTLATQLAAQNESDAAKLAALQKGDGGWGWCFSGSSDPWLSAQSLLSLTRAAELGYEVDAAVPESGAEYVRGQLEPVNRLGDASEANRQAFFLYVMAVAGDDVADDADELVAEHRALLDPYAKALLAMAGAWPMVLAARFTDRVGKGLRGPPRDAIIA